LNIFGGKIINFWKRIVKVFRKMESKKGLDNIYIKKRRSSEKVKIKNFSALRSHSIFLPTNNTVACTEICSSVRERNLHRLLAMRTDMPSNVQNAG